MSLSPQVHFSNDGILGFLFAFDCIYFFLGARTHSQLPFSMQSFSTRFQNPVFWPKLLALVLLFPALGFSALKWDSQRIEVKTQPGDKIATGIFHFVNSGSAPVTIASVQPGCGCTTAEIAKKTYAPQEAGEIKAILTIGDRVGLQEKIVSVTTQDDPFAPTQLMLSVTIPELLTYSPRLLLWPKTEPLTEKSVILTNTSPQKILSIEAAPGAPTTATARIEIIEPGAKYRIYIKPNAVTQETYLPIIFVAKFADSSTLKFQIHALVK